MEGHSDVGICHVEESRVASRWTGPALPSPKVIFGFPQSRWIGVYVSCSLVVERSDSGSWLLAMDASWSKRVGSRSGIVKHAFTAILLFPAFFEGETAFNAMRSQGWKRLIGRCEHGQLTSSSECTIIYKRDPVPRLHSPGARPRPRPRPNLRRSHSVATRKSRMR